MSSPVEIDCPSCAMALKVPPAVFGKKIKCKHCGHAFVVQDPEGKSAPARPTKPGGKPAPKPAPKAEAKPAASPPPPPPPAAPAKSPFMDDEDEGPKIEVVKEEDTARCPHCAKELEPPDAVVCIHCGFNNVTRARAETKKVWAPDAMDWFNHLAPGIVALLIVIGLIVWNTIALINMRSWMEGGMLETDELDATGKKKMYVAPGFFICFSIITSLAPAVPSAKFAWKRLVNNYMPPEKIKK